MLTSDGRLSRLDPLVAFDAAARHGSFAHAASELNVTPSAVSQQIRGLEDGLGTALFDRAHRAVHLTDQGRTFHNSVAVALLHLLNAATELRGDKQNPAIEIATDTSVVAFWLGARLGQFRAAHPTVSVRLTASDLQSELLSEKLDIGIVHGAGNFPGFQSQLLFEEAVFPVCSPEYARRITDDADLSKCELLDLDYARWNWMNWAIWLTEADLELPNKPRYLRSNSYSSIIDAALRDEGIALGWRGLVDELLDAGRLVRASDRTVVTGQAYHVIWPFNSELSDASALFRDHLLGA